MFYTVEELRTMAEKLEALPVEKIGDRFGNEYEYLYQHRDRIAGYADAVQAGDEILTAMHGTPLENQFRRLIEYRQDLITSDRECAALAWTFAAVIDETPDPLTGELLML